MLSQDDRRELELIADYLRREDPAFAKALAEGRPRRPAGDQRWPLLIAGLAGALVFLIGLVAQAVLVMVPAALAVGGVALAYQRHVRRAQGAAG